jgi:DNA-directed RNA polymerase specialized sigma24 family protein
MACFDAIRSKSTFGSISSPSAVRDDVLNRRKRVDLNRRRDRDIDETGNALDHIEYQPVEYDVQRWEVEQVADRELPVHLRSTAVNRACGMTLQQSATLQGVSVRTVSYRLRQAQAYLSGEPA